VTDVLPGADRVTSWRVEILDTNEVLLGTLTGAQVGGELEWVSTASVKGGGRITVQNLDDVVIDWLNVRLRPVVTISDLVPTPDTLTVEMPIGVFLPSAPVTTWDGTGSGLDVELHDKCALLDSDIWTDIDGVPATYIALVGEQVLELIRDLIEATGEATTAIEADASLLVTSTLTWDVGTTRLRIINDLLDAAGYFSLWVDGWGNFRATPYTTPASRAPRFSVMAPFEVGATSLWAPEWTADEDIYAVPNRVVAVSQGDGDTAALTSTATNTDPLSPYSSVSRGRWITLVETGVEAVDQAALDTYAARRLTEVTSVTSTLTIKHAPLPGLNVNDVVRVVNPAAEIDSLAVVRQTMIPLSCTAMAESTLVEVT
jgi:hypothetical protein